MDIVNQFLNFNKLMGQGLVKIFYYLGLIGIALFVLFGILGGLRGDDPRFRHRPRHADRRADLQVAGVAGRQRACSIPRSSPPSQPENCPTLAWCWAWTTFPSRAMTTSAPAKTS